MTYSEAARTLRSLAALALTAMVALISACGSNVPAQTGTGGNNSAANLAKAVKFAQCMRANGVSAFPDPDASGQLTIDGVANGSSVDPSSAVFIQAISACKDLEPPGLMGHQRSPEQQKVALKFAQCMRDNGVPDFPDPTPNGPLIDTTRIPSVGDKDPHSIPALQAAMGKCTAIYAAGMGLRGP
ncbi:MAG TPA: hypothetical protein VIO62_12255 [Candidatus Dormibacteraeota bacterium]|jgi:hypothetical protein